MVLEAGLRRRMESRLGTSLDDVRVHTGPDAARATAARGARALTLGLDIFFAPGRFAPHTTEGEVRLAHELVHVEQQRAGRRGGSAVSPRAAEAEARTLGAAVAAGSNVRVRGTASAAMQADGPDPEPTVGTQVLPPWQVQLQLDPEIERLMLQHYIRWWLGSALVLGEAPTSLPAPGSADEYGPDAAEGDSATAAPGPGVPFMPSLPLAPDLFAPLPPDPLFLEPDVGAVFSPFGARGAPVGAGDADAAMAIYRRNAAIASGLPDLRSMAPRFIRPLIPSTWRRDIAGALTGAAIGASLNRDFATPIEISDRAFQGMTGASTTVIPLPSISFDFP